MPAFVTLMAKMQFLMFRNHFGGQRKAPGCLCTFSSTIYGY